MPIFSWAAVAFFLRHQLLHAASLARPDYRKLGILRQQFPDVPIIALTATATDRVSRDLCEILRIEGCETFRSSINRANLFYEVSG